jgi:hypothetical protein
MAKKVNFDTLRSLAYTGISASYAALGPPTTVNGRVICITNKTQGDVIVSTDNTNADGMMFLAAGTYKTFDFETNMNQMRDDGFLLGIGVQFYVKQVTAPTSGAVYLELLYAN